LYFLKKGRKGFIERIGASRARGKSTRGHSKSAANRKKRILNANQHNNIETAKTLWLQLRELATSARKPKLNKSPRDKRNNIRAFVRGAKDEILCPTRQQNCSFLQAQIKNQTQNFLM